MKHTIIWMAIVIHLIWAVLLLLSPSVTQVTGINLLYQVFPNRVILAGVLTLSSFLAYLALTKYNKVKSLSFILPQQFLLIIPALQVIMIVIAGHFADGTIRPRPFLTADKISIVLFAIFHTMSLLKFHKLDEE